MKQNVVRLACSQNGSRYLQKELNKADPAFIEFLLEDIEINLSKIMVDRYGNYFCQKMLSCCSQKQLIKVLNLIKEDFISICCDQKGTHTVQSLLENIGIAEQEEFILQSLPNKVFLLSVVSNTHFKQCLGLNGNPCDSETSLSSCKTI